LVCPWGSGDNSGCGFPAGYPPIISIDLLLVILLCGKAEGSRMKAEGYFILHPSALIPLTGSGAVFNLGYLFYLLSLTFAQMIT